MSRSTLRSGLSLQKAPHSSLLTEFTFMSVSNWSSPFWIVLQGNQKGSQPHRGFAYFGHSHMLRTHTHNTLAWEIISLEQKLIMGLLVIAGLSSSMQICLKADSFCFLSGSRKALGHQMLVPPCCPLVSLQDLSSAFALGVTSNAQPRLAV